MKDPVWDSYEDEDILVEYYAYLYSNSEDERSKFEASLQGDGYNEDIYAWLDKMVEQNQKDTKELAAKQEDIEFTPNSLGD